MKEYKIWMTGGMLVWLMYLVLSLVVMSKVVAGMLM